jgi:hypothetical protein
MGRGLGDLQKGILGLAWTVNAHTQGGKPRVKPADTREFIPFDFACALGVCILYGIAPALEIRRIDHRLGEIIQRSGGWFVGTPEVHRARVATCRAANHLVKRELLAYRVNKRFTGYLLTEEGMVIAEANKRPIPLIDETLAFFEIIPGCGLRNDPHWWDRQRDYVEALRPLLVNGPAPAMDT